jgi:hypothetical protein
VDVQLRQLQVGRGGGDVGVVRAGELAPTYNVLLH